jgi:hypothetical protein
VRRATRLTPTAPRAQGRSASSTLDERHGLGFGFAHRLGRRSIVATLVNELVGLCASEHKRIYVLQLVMSGRAAEIGVVDDPPYFILTFDRNIRTLALV